MRHLLGDAGDVGAQAPGALGGDRRHDHGGVVAPGPAVDGGGQERGPGAQGQRGRSRRHGGALTEELDLDPVADDVAVAQQPDEAPAAQRPQEDAPGVGVRGARW